MSQAKLDIKVNPVAAKIQERSAMILRLILSIQNVDRDLVLGDEVVRLPPIPNYARDAIQMWFTAANGVLQDALNTQYLFDVLDPLLLPQQKKVLEKVAEKADKLPKKGKKKTVKFDLR